MKKIYLVCPVRNCPDDIRELMDAYVRGLEASGNCKVHYPHRDANQQGSADEICRTHVEAMAICDEVHFWWDHESRGSLFDFGMAYMLRYMKTGIHIRFIFANRETYERIDTTGYTKYLLELTKKDEGKEGDNPSEREEKMAEKELTQMFKKMFDEKLGYYLEIADYFWKHWDELAAKQELYVLGGGDAGSDPSFKNKPLEFISYEIWRNMFDITIEDLDAMLYHNCNWRRRPGKGNFHKMTKKTFVEKFCYYFGLALPEEHKYTKED